ncbi:MAG: hypothetical protein PHP92_03350 [Candidatus Nanoarchaeia archaeon]|nr:hypothetical protein [Candidatus Nanoarchaeia archaeon]
MPAEFDFFQKFPNNYFLETGSYLGYGVEQALKAGFKNILSIEVNEEYYKQCVKKFKGNSNVKLFLGDSKKMLWDMIKNINDQITFWLDSHYFVSQDVPSGEKLSTLMDEIDIIYRHNVKTHKILIDDVRLWKTDYGVDIEDVKRKIKNINSNYGFTRGTGHESLPNDIFIAQVYV